MICSPTGHQPVLSEPSLTLCCTACGSWLKQVFPSVCETCDSTGAVACDGTACFCLPCPDCMETYEVVPREQADRGVHVCPRCETEWVGDEDFCEECGLPTWDTDHNED